MELFGEIDDLNIYREDFIVEDVQEISNQKLNLLCKSLKNSEIRKIIINDIKKDSLYIKGEEIILLFIKDKKGIYEPVHIYNYKSGIGRAYYPQSISDKFTFEYFQDKISDLFAFKVLF